MLSLVAEVDEIKTQFEKLTPFLDERMRRLAAATESLAVGFGGTAAEKELKQSTAAVSRQTGVSRRAVIQGIKEPDEAPTAQAGRVRREGGAARRPSTQTRR